MPEISKKKHLLPSFCKYLLTISHGKKHTKNIPRKMLPSRDVCNTFLPFSVGFAARRFDSPPR